MRTKTFLLGAALALLVAGLLSGCGDDEGATTCTPGQVTDCIGAGGCQGRHVCNGTGSGYGACQCSLDGGSGDAGTCAEGAKRCEAKTLERCTSGSWTTAEQCPTACDPTFGCVQCVPGSRSCVEGNVVACTNEGEPGTIIARCQEACEDGHCTDACGQAEEARSYLGCEYWPTVTMNSMVNADTFHFGVVVANASPTADPAEITITGAKLTSPITQTVASAGLATITLPWVPELKQTFNQPTQNEQSVLLVDGAYHLVSNQPVAVFQFNPLESLVGQEPSWGSDASLLLPQNVLAGDAGGSAYYVMTRPTLERHCQGSQTTWSPGVFAVVATEDFTHVDITFRAHTLAGTDVAQAYQPGQSATFPLASAGRVLMIASAHDDSCTGGTPDSTNCSYCDLTDGYDLTGTRIASDKPVAVYAAHNCAYVPYNKPACDHLEEQLLPVSAWGTRYIATHSTSTTDPNVWRVLSAEDDNEIQFTPAVTAPVTLDRGEWTEVVTAQDFEVTGTAPFTLAGFMVGQNYSNPNPGQGAPGDPSMTQVAPVGQFRTSYVFAIPEAFDQSWVTIVAASGATVELDGTAVSGFVAVGTGDFRVASTTVGAGVHTITSDEKLGLQVYGVGPYASYMYPGGLDVNTLYKE